MIDLLKNLQQHKNYVAETRSRPQEKDGVVIVDVGTGSGCLAITAKLEFTAATVYGTDISDSALTVAQKNAKNLNADVTFLKGNLLEPYYILPPEPSTLVLLCNLPYVPNNYEINQAAGYEPSIALFGGQDGLDLYRELFDQISKLQDPSSKIAFILTESLPFQHAELAKIAAQQGYKLETSEDFIQVFKR